MTAPVGDDLTWLDECPQVARRLKVNPETGCWEWQGYRLGGAYGQLSVRGVSWLTHRFVWTTLHGPIPDGLFVCHRCDNPPCCNPEHLFLGNALVNVRDMLTKGRNRNGFTEMTHCCYGHPLSGDNLAFGRNSNGRPKRRCRTCERRREQRRREQGRGRRATAALTPESVTT